jgi:hypothetical protein
LYCVKLSDRKVERLLSNLDIKSFATRDEQEGAGYAETMELIYRFWNEITLTENHIKQLHRDLLRYSEKGAHHRGKYKTQPNHVAAFDGTGKQVGIMFEAATSFDTPRRMTEQADLAARDAKADVPLKCCKWEDLPAHFTDPFELVFCQSNTIGHPRSGEECFGRCKGMRAALRSGGKLVINSCN